MEKLGLRLSGRFQFLIWGPGDTVEHVEYPGLSGRVDSSAIIKIKVKILP